MKQKNLISLIIVAVILSGLSFYGGMLYQKSHQSSLPKAIGQGNNQTGQWSNRGKEDSNQQNRGANFSRPINGEITATDDKTITIKTQDGNSKIIIYSSSTKVNKSTEGSITDLKVGEQVMVMGNEGTDGTVTAQTINVGNVAFQGLRANPT